MPKQYLPNTVNYDGSHTCRTLATQDLNWYSAFFTYFSDVTTGGTASSFVVPYVDGYKLYDFYKSGYDLAVYLIPKDEDYVFNSRPYMRILIVDFFLQ
jgi:hypothetical protein